jgi:hypothetical protein
MLALVGACVERVTIDTNSQSPKLVVIAMLTTDTVPQQVTLTKSTNYFGGDTCPAVTDAKVWINDEPLTLLDAAKGTYATQSAFPAVPGALYTLRIRCDMDGDGADEEFWAEDVAPHSMSMLGTILTPINMDADTSIYAPPFIISAVIRRDNVSDSYVYVTGYYQGKKRTETLSQYDVGSIPYGFSNIVAVPRIGSITRNGFLLDGQPDTVFYCPFETVSLRVNALSEALYRYISSAQIESRGSGNPMFGGAPANAESNIHGDNVVGCFGAYAAGPPASFVLPMNTKTLDGDNEWFNLNDTTLRISIQNEGIATYLSGARKGQQYFRMLSVDARSKGFWAYQDGDTSRRRMFTMKSYDEFWSVRDGEKWQRGRGWR